MTTDLGTAWLVLDADGRPLRDSEGWVLNFDGPCEAEAHADDLPVDTIALDVVEAQCWVNHRRRWWVDLHSDEEWPAQEG